MYDPEVAGLVWSQADVMDLFSARGTTYRSTADLAALMNISRHPPSTSPERDSRPDPTTAL
jgi:hypothetical protein